MTAPIRTTSQVAHDALEDLENAKRTHKHLEALLHAISRASEGQSHIRDLADLGCFVAADAANYLDCQIVEIGRQLNVATQNAESQNVSRHSEVPV